MIEHKQKIHLAIYIEEDFFCIHTINFIYESKHLQLLLNLITLSNLSIIQLKELYVTRLSQSTSKNQNGANIGVILLFLNSNKNVNFNFGVINEHLLNFELIIKIKIKREKN